MGCDPDGKWLNVVIGAVIGAAINITVSYTVSKASGKEYSWKNALIDGIGGAVTGGLAATGLGAVAQAIGGALVSGVTSAANDFAEEREVDWARALNAAAFGGAMSFVAGGGLLSDPGVQKATETCGKVLSRVESGSYYSCIQGAKSAMTQASNRLKKAAANAAWRCSSKYIGSTVHTAIGMTIYDEIQRY